jgi:hypothetical protein
MVRNAIDRLPVNYRRVLLLRDIEELDTDETASLRLLDPGTGRHGPCWCTPRATLLHPIARAAFRVLRA